MRTHDIQITAPNATRRSSQWQVVFMRGVGCLSFCQSMTGRTEVGGKMDAKMNPWF